MREMVFYNLDAIIAVGYRRNGRVGKDELTDFVFLVHHEPHSIPQCWRKLPFVNKTTMLVYWAQHQ